MHMNLMTPCVGLLGSVQVSSFHDPLYCVILLLVPFNVHCFSFFLHGAFSSHHPTPQSFSPQFLVCVFIWLSRCDMQTAQHGCNAATDDAPTAKRPLTAQQQA